LMQGNCPFRRCTALQLSLSSGNGVIPLFWRELPEQLFQLCIGNLLLQPSALCKRYQLLLDRSGKLGFGQLDGIQPFPCIGLENLHEYHLDLGFLPLLAFELFLHALLIDSLLLQLCHPAPAKFC
jgi:hypothetical protein